MLAKDCIVKQEYMVVVYTSTFKYPKAYHPDVSLLPIGQNFPSSKVKRYMYVSLLSNLLYRLQKHSITSLLVSTVITPEI